MNKLFNNVLLLLVPLIFEAANANTNEYNHERSIMKIMDEDVAAESDITEFKNSNNSVESSGDDNNGDNHDLTPDQLNATEILAIVVCSIIGLAVIVFIVSCAYYKVKSRRRGVFMHITDEAADDESMLYMVDYDEINIQHGELSVQITPESHQTSSTIREQPSSSSLQLKT